MEFTKIKYNQINKRNLFNLHSGSITLMFHYFLCKRKAYIRKLIQSNYSSETAFLMYILHCHLHYLINEKYDLSNVELSNICKT